MFTCTQCDYDLCHSCYIKFYKPPSYLPITLKGETVLVQVASDTDTFATWRVMNALT